MKKVYLGRSGLKVSIAGFGVLPMGPSQLALPVEEGASLIKYAIQKGINFFDTAQYYRTYPYIRKALDELPKEEANNLIICSKSLCWDYEGMMEAILEAREELNREVIDIFLMHEVRSGQLELRADAWNALIDAKANGLVKAIGLSTHHVDVTNAAASIEELDVVFPLINYASMGIRKGDDFATKEEMMDAIEKCRQAGKGIFSMKAFGGGTLTGSYQEALNYVFSKPAIDSVMIGFGKIQEVDDLLSYLDGTMDSSYNPDVSKKKVYVNQEDCEGCGACKAACPAQAIFYNENGLAEVDQNKCLTCGYCSPVCPVRAVIMY
ncbi:MAG: 4Fe-4S dicluster domain-containing protein [Lachnospiraceae bacterium]|nr:4Fe-4S dicluster domain-containing protein [Lachnospiraceae bacterium]